MPVKGTQALINKINKLSADFQQEAKEIVSFRTGEIELGAKRDAPGGGDLIRTQFGSVSQDKIARGRNWTPISQAITSNESSNGYKGTVIVDKSAGEIAAWVEFGTGQSAASYLSTVEPEWRALAQTYYINGKGSIINQPYLYPNYLKQRALFIKDLKDLLKKSRL